MKSYDVAVIGAGVFGSWIAYRLAGEGRTVALVEAYGPAHSRASSSGETRIIRMAYGQDELYTRMSFRSLPLWQDFFEREKQPLFHQTGVLWFGPPGAPPLRESSAVLRKVGVPFEELASAEIAYRYPQIRFDGDAEAIYEPFSGALMARRAVQAVAAAALAEGADFLHELVLPPVGPPGAHGFRTASGAKLLAGTYVFACGPWLRKVFPGVVGGRIHPTRQEVLFFGIPPGDRRFSPPAMPVWLDRFEETLPYGLPEIEQRGFKIAFDAHGPVVDPDTGDRIVERSTVEQARRFFAGRFPALAEAPLIESRVCQYENTSSGDFLIDRHPDWPGVWFAGGGSGHGFKHGPAVGAYVADVLAGRLEAEPRFSLASKQEARLRAVY